MPKINEIFIIYILIGMTMTTVVDIIDRRKGGGFSVLNFVISTLLWPAFFVITLTRKNNDT